MDLEQIESPEAATLYDRLVVVIEKALKNKDLERIVSILKLLSGYKHVPGTKPSPEFLTLQLLRSQGYLTRLYSARDNLYKTIDMYEGSGYIPSEAEKNDPRWKMALTTDVNPYTMKKSAKKFGWKIKRDGSPPNLRP